MIVGVLAWLMDRPCLLDPFPWGDRPLAWWLARALPRAWDAAEELRCNVDVGGCSGGVDPETVERRTCSKCRAWMEESERDARREWEAASPAERDPESYARDMIDGGRGHLLRSEERERVR